MRFILLFIAALAYAEDAPKPIDPLGPYRAAFWKILYEQTQAEGVAEAKKREIQPIIDAMTKACGEQMLSIDPMTQEVICVKRPKEEKKQ